MWSFFNRKANGFPLGKNKSELVSSGTLDKSIQNVFDALLETRYERRPPQVHGQTPIREVRLDGQTYYACARSQAICFCCSREYDYALSKALIFYVLEPNGSIAKYRYKKEERVECTNDPYEDTTPLDINSVRRQTKDEKLANMIDSFFLVTPEERQAYTTGMTYPDMYRQIDPKYFVKRTKIIEEIKNKPFHYEPHYYAKRAWISARPGKVGEEIVTVMKDNHKETKNTVKNEGDMVVTNPSGEQYIIEAKTFAKKYEIDPHNPERYRPIGGLQEFMILKENVMFEAPWGEQMMIKKGGALNVTNMDEIYGIQQSEFNETYVPCDKDGRFSREDLRKLFWEEHDATEREHLATQLRQGDEERNARAAKLREMRKTRDAYNAARARRNKGSAR